MAKPKPGTIQNRATYSRLSFMYQAAACLAQTTKQQTTNSKPVNPTQTDGDVVMGDDGTRPGRQEDETTAAAQGQGLSRQLLTDLRNVTKKAVIRISPEMKRTMCKSCDTFLVEGQTCASTVENKSKGGKRPWADVLVIKCNTCGREKRFPVNAPRQKRKHIRPPKEQKVPEQECAPKGLEETERTAAPNDQVSSKEQGAPTKTAGSEKQELSNSQAQQRSGP